MKKILIFSMFLFLIKGYAQTNPADETITLDQMLTNVNQSSVTSGIIYERVAQFANLYNFNTSDSLNIADFKYFKQALSEMHRASNKTKFISVEELKKRVEPNLYNDSVIDMAILNTPFQILNYNEANPTAGGLTFNATTNRFSQISGKAPFYTLHTTVIAPLKERVIASRLVHFKWSNNLIFQNTSKTIKSLVADFGNGTSPQTIILNGSLIQTTTSIPYVFSGKITMTFNITYSDNTTATTKSTFNYQSDIEVEDFGSSECGNDYGLTQDRNITSNYAFKGYDETFAFKGFIKYRVFYKTGSTDPKILKPIIIVDGFDPGDKRKILPCDYENGQYDGKSLADLMKYTDHDGKTKDLIKELQQKGYDVIIVNQPSYAIMKTAPYQVVSRGTAGSREVDGGADYIERNALNLATLIIQVNKEVKDNGSTEKLVVIGPSMGGQISRYALAWMEKNNIPHNTRLWVSVDSPHLGANIPLGAQALLNFLKEESEDAKDFYNNQLGSVAAKQQIIERHKQGQVFLPFFYRWVETNTKVDNNYLNGKTISQGFPSNSGESFYQTYYNNLFTNGLAGSKGYPKNLRKIALTNGSLTGERTGSDNEKVLNIKGFQKVCINTYIFGKYCFDVHIASMESNFMPAFGAGEQSIARFKKAFKDRTTKASNLNSRGNMDSVPGGWFPTQNELAGSILAKRPINGISLTSIISHMLGGSYFELRDFRFNNSFIPTFSSLGMLNPNQDWGSSLNRNLVCTKEIPFDSFYGETQNTQHTSFNAESISWLFKELGDSKTLPTPQPSVYPAAPNLIKGSDKICRYANTKYSVENMPVGTKYFWDRNNTSGELQIISGQGTKEVTVMSVADNPLKPFHELSVMITKPDGCTEKAVKKLYPLVPNQKIEMKCAGTYCPCVRDVRYVYFDFVVTTNKIKPEKFYYTTSYDNKYGFNVSREAIPVSDGNGNWIGRFSMVGSGSNSYGDPLIIEAKTRANECSPWCTYVTYIGGCTPTLYGLRTADNSLNNTSKNSFITNISPNPASNKIIVTISENTSALKNTIADYENRTLTDEEVNEYRKKMVALENNKKLPFTIEIRNIDGYKVKESKLKNYGSSEINITNLPAGIYVIHISNGTEQIIENLIKN